MHRLRTVSGHISALAAQPTSAGALASSEKSPDDVVICCAVRTAITKARKGGFKDTGVEDMLGPLFEEVLKRTKLNPKIVGDVQIGNVTLQGVGVTARMAQLLHGFPSDVSTSVINRQCGSGLQAVANVAASIKAGVMDVGLAGGVESMTQTGMNVLPELKTLNPQLVEAIKAGKSDDAVVDTAIGCMAPAGITSENVAERWGISRERQDELAMQSHKKAAEAQKLGLFDSEIVPVHTQVREKDGTTREVEVNADEGPRAETSMASLAKLKAAFKEGGSTHAGNASQVSDGAALVLLARRSVAEKQGLPILGRFRSYAVVGVEPSVMGIGPAFAIPAALQSANLSIDDVDIFEINEAFASQVVMTEEHLKLPREKLNPKGGAIALGHPLGMTGARQIASLLPELRRTGKKRGVTSMCIGTGMGAASVIELE